MKYLGLLFAAVLVSEEHFLGSIFSLSPSV